MVNHLSLIVDVWAESGRKFMRSSKQFFQDLSKLSNEFDITIKHNSKEAYLCKQFL